MGIFVGAVVLQDEMELRAGTSRSTRRQKRMNSLLRCLGSYSPTTLPVSTTSAANNVVLRCRCRRQSWVMAPAGPRLRAVLSGCGPALESWHLLVHAQHHRPIGRVEVEPDDVDELVLEVLVVRQLEGVDPVRLEPPRRADPPHRRRAHPLRLGHTPHRPVGLPERLGVKGGIDDGVHPGLRDRRLAPRPLQLTPTRVVRGGGYVL